MYMIDEGKVFTCTRLFTMSSILIPVEDADTSPIIFWASKLSDPSGDRMVEKLLMGGCRLKVSVPVLRFYQ